jgi:P-type Ca2+ transporter type 2C
MCVIRFCTASDNSRDGLDTYDVGGHSYAPIGEISANQDGAGSIQDQMGRKADGIMTFARIGALCNDSRIDVDEESGHKYTRTGEPTEAAIRVLVEKMGCPDKALNSRLLQAPERNQRDSQGFSNYWAKDFHKLATLEFTRDRKSMGVLGKLEVRREMVMV